MNIYLYLNNKKVLINNLSDFDKHLTIQRSTYALPRPGNQFILAEDESDFSVWAELCMYWHKTDVINLKYLECKQLFVLC